MWSSSIISLMQADDKLVGVGHAMTLRGFTFFVRRAAMKQVRDLHGLAVSQGSAVGDYRDRCRANSLGLLGKRQYLEVLIRYSGKVWQLHLGLMAVFSSRIIVRDSNHTGSKHAATFNTSTEN